MPFKGAFVVPKAPQKPAICSVDFMQAALAMFAFAITGFNSITTKHTLLLN